MLDKGGIASDNCSTRVNTALDAAGINDGPIGPGSPVLPGSAGGRAVASGLPWSLINVPQGSNFSNLKESDQQRLREFEPTQSNTEDRQMKPPRNN
jgi:hypothetical protein